MHRLRQRARRMRLPIVVLIVLVNIAFAPSITAIANGAASAMLAPGGESPDGSTLRSDAHSVKETYLYAPSARCAAGTHDHWTTPLSAEIDAADVQSALFKALKNTVPTVVGSLSMDPPVTLQRQRFTPLYLALLTFRC